MFGWVGEWLVLKELTSGNLGTVASREWRGIVWDTWQEEEEVEEGKKVAEVGYYLSLAQLLND